MEKQISFLPTTPSRKKQKPLLSLSERWTIYVDGAARGNPGQAGAGIYVINQEQEIILKKGFYLGHKTNNQAEYLALLLALFLVKKECSKHSLEIPSLSIVSDSELLVKQMQGIYKVINPTLLNLKKIIISMLVGVDYSCNHVIRKHNSIADAMANQGIDRKQVLPDDFKKFLSDYHLLM